MVYKRDWGYVSGHKIIFTVTHQERVRREKKDKKIYLETVVGEHTKLQIKEQIFTRFLINQC